MKRIRTILAIIFVLLAGTLATLYAIVISTDLNSYKTAISERVEERLGRQFYIDGDIGLELSLLPTISLANIRMENADWAQNPTMASVGRVEARIAILPLINGDIEIHSLVMDDVDLFLEWGPDGPANWDFGIARQAKQDEAQGIYSVTPIPVLEELDIEGFRLTYRDSATGRVDILDLETLQVRDDLGSPLMEVSFTGALDEIPFSGGGEISSIRDILAGNPVTVDIAFDYGSTEFSIKGTGDDLNEITGLNFVLTAAGSDPESFEPILGIDLPFAKPFELRAEVTDTDIGYELKSWSAIIGDTEITGTASLSLETEIPDITFNATAKKVLLNDFFAAESKDQNENKDQSASSKGAEKLFSDEPLPFDYLKQIDAQGTVTITELDIHDAIVRDLEAGIALKDGVLNITDTKAKFAGGDGLLTGALDSRGGIPSLSLNFEAVGMSLAKVFKETKISDAYTGLPLTGTMDLRSKGESIADIMGGLNGTIRAQTGEGQVDYTEFDFASEAEMTQAILALNPLASKRAAGDIFCTAMVIKITNGLAEADRGLGLEGGAITIQGSGRVDLKEEQMSLRLRPNTTHRAKFSLAQLGAGLVTIEGPLADPELTIDSISALGASARAGAAFMTGGLSLLGEVLIATQADTNPCATALGVKPKSEPNNPPEDSEPDEPFEYKDGVDN